MGAWTPEVLRLFGRHIGMLIYVHCWIYPELSIYRVAGCSAALPYQGYQC